MSDTARDQAAAQVLSIVKMVRATQVGRADEEEDAWRRIDEDPLSVEYRSSWTPPGELLTPEEFRIVLCTGGPHVELRGDITDDGGPHRITVHYQGWSEYGEYFDITDEARGALQTYCERFIAG